jgi:microcystin degradation protein MlrC
MPRKRLAFARLAQESNALSPVTSELADFERTHFLEGQALRDACGPRGYEVRGFIKNAELSGFVRAASRYGDAFELLPVYSAWAVPGGPLSRAAFDHLRERLLDGLRRLLPLDGVFLAMHGALCVRDLDDAEGRLIQAVRALVGDGVPIAVTLDLHANLTRRKVDGDTLICAYRTNPHRDHYKVGQRAGDLLCRTALGQIRPTTAWRSLPLVLGGGTTMDFLSPMRQIYAWMRRQERNPKVGYLSLFNCHLWLDHEEMGWATHVITDGEPGLAEELAERLAELAWEVRHQQPPTFPTASEAIVLARDARIARRLGTVCMSDASDMVGAGGTGENTALLRAFLGEGADLRTLLPLRDPEAVAALWPRKPGDRVDITVGGRLDPARNAPVDVHGTLRGNHEVEGFGRISVVDAGKLSLALTEGAALVMQPRFYTRLGLSPWSADVVVVKSLFPFRLYFALHNRKTIYAKTNGITDFDAGLRATTFACPVWPKDPVEDWRPTDRRRRAV